MTVKDRERYVKQMKTAMAKMEEIAGDTDAPLGDRVYAIHRVITFWQGLVDNLDPPNPPKEAEA